MEARVDDLVSRMTLEEKVSQMQNQAAAIPRLGIPAYDWWSEAIHGVAISGYATVFPQAIGMAASWDIDLIRREASIISTEARAKYTDAISHGNHTIYYGLDLWAPNINIFRDPRWGRGQETYGEDPFLTSRIGVTFIESLQGGDHKYLKVVATPKHYAVHSGPESLRHKFNVDVAPYDLTDTYLPAFRAAITEAHAESIMCAYSAVDGEPACANKMLLQDYLRNEWKFSGYVTSDCGAVEDIAKGHKFASDLEAASIAAVRAGTDTTCGTEFPTLVQAVKDHKIAESEIDQAVRRLMTARFRLGMFDDPAVVPYAHIPFSENNSDEHRAIALEAANKSIVLLKNDHVLPLHANPGTVAVVGPNAANLFSIEGNYNGIPSDPVIPLKGLETYFKGRAKIVYSQGSSFTSELPIGVPPSAFHLGANDAEVGLKGEYFANTNFSGSPVVTRTDPQMDFDWQSASPVPGLTSSEYSVRWSGTIQAPGPGEYKFQFREGDCSPCVGTDSIRFLVDGQQVFQGGRKETEFQNSPFTIHFNGTEPHPIMIEYIHNASYRGGGLRLDWQPDAQALRDAAVTAADQADVVVAFMGLSPDLEGEEMPIHVNGFDGGDRTDIGLPGVQQQLLEAVARTGKPLIVVLMNGSALAVNWAQQHASAIIEAWYPGEEGGTAIAQTLAGQNNPAGRLPITFYSSAKDLPPFTDYSMKNRTYRYFKGEVLYPFGYGLSYTTFSYGKLTMSSPEVKAGQSLLVEADITNTGKVKGDEVAELYLSYPGRPNAPIRALKGFKRISLDVGATAHVHFELNPRDLSLVRDDGAREILSGTYNLYVGGSQPAADGSGLQGHFRIIGTRLLPK